MPGWGLDRSRPRPAAEDHLAQLAPPGRLWSYNNTGYYLLGVIIERGHRHVCAGVGERGGELVGHRPVLDEHHLGRRAGLLHHGRLERVAEEAGVVAGVGRDQQAERLAGPERVGGALPPGAEQDVGRYDTVDALERIAPVDGDPRGDGVSAVANPR